MKELRYDTRDVNPGYCKPERLPVCPICGGWLFPWHFPSECCEDAPCIQLTTKPPHAHLIQDLDNDWWLFPREWGYDGETDLQMDAVRYVPDPTGVILEYVDRGYAHVANLQAFVDNLCETLQQFK